MDKEWCHYCNKFTYSTTAGCVECHNISPNYKSGTITSDIKKFETDPVEDYNDITEPI